ncbi:MAG: DUF2500 family protein [Lachnospiraceae bacterium]|nr:DUF2500 family protein [Lachnospiraceae bacterium]
MNDYKMMLIYAGLLIVFIFMMRLITNRINKPKGPKNTISARLVEKVRGPEVDEDGKEILTAVFITLSGKEIIKLKVKTRVFRELPEDAVGTLTYAGDEFLRFESQGRMIEK